MENIINNGPIAVALTALTLLSVLILHLSVDKSCVIKAQKVNKILDISMIL